jgi:hypothetical protein
MNTSYDQFEVLLRETDHLKNVEFLANLAQLAVGSESAQRNSIADRSHKVSTETNKRRRKRAYF